MNERGAYALPFLAAFLFLLLLSGVRVSVIPIYGAWPRYQENQLPGVLGLEIDISTLREWQQRKFLKGDLSRGARGEEVRFVQKALNVDASIFPGHATGYFGKNTEEAVRRFQKANGLVETGMVDFLTRAAVNELYFRELCPKPAGQFSDLTFERIGKDKSLPEGYAPPDLVDISASVHTTGVACLRREAAVFLEWIMQDAAKEGIYLAVTSGYRREEVQEILYISLWNMMGEDAPQEIAWPGHSEHQLGTAVDFTGASIEYTGVSLSFGESAEGKWLQKNGYRYGFIMSYPAGKEDITGYAYEPWHWRYVGAKAGEIYQKGITFAEFAEE